MPGNKEAHEILSLSLGMGRVIARKTDLTCVCHGGFSIIGETPGTGALAIDSNCFMRTQNPHGQLCLA